MSEIVWRVSPRRNSPATSGAAVLSNASSIMPARPRDGHGASAADVEDAEIRARIPQHQHVGAGESRTFT